MSKLGSELGHHSSRARKPGSSKNVRMEPGGRDQVASGARFTTAASNRYARPLGDGLFLHLALVTDRDIPLIAQA